MAVLKAVLTLVEKGLFNAYHFSFIVTQANQGFVYALSAFVLWGVVPIFWKQLGDISSFEIIAHRMVWACLIVFFVLVFSGKLTAFKALFSQPKIVIRSVLAGSLILSNWFMFIWAVSNEYIVQVSMGYFINPLISVMIGVLLFREKLRRGQMVPLSIIVVAVCYQVFSQGQVPWVALFLAFTFAFYGAVKKTIKLPVVQGMALETVFFVVPAVLYLLILGRQGEGAFGTQIEISFMLFMAGVFTIVPLLLFAMAAKRATMTVLGMAQYVAPSLQLIVGVMIYKESFGQAQLITFCLIWLALIIYSVDQFTHYKNRHKA